jgi:FAD/FMN-containing dehydrogenase
MLLPICSVKPAIANDVSHVLRIAKAQQCPFAVASGGHMAWKGSSNINEGFLIDLRALDHIDISPEDLTVRLGPGATWINVYAAMEPYNLTMAGGRISSVGVGGFLLGGKFSCSLSRLMSC